jgi:chromosome segregation ATPase
VSELLRRGRLLEDRQISELGLIGGPGRPTPRSSSEQRKRTQLRRRLEQARERQQKLDEKLEQALRNAELADRQVTKARGELERAETNAARSRAEAERAREQATAGAERLRELDKPDP